MINNKKGMSLIEVTVIIALLLVVTSVAFSLLMAGNNNFTRSKLRSDMQFEVRMVSDFIRDELRYATEIELMDTPESFVAGSEYILIEGSIMKHVNAAGVKSNKATFNMTEFNPMFILEAVGSNNMLNYHIEGTDDSTLGTKSYEVMTKVFLNNIEENPDAQGQTIRYKKP